VTEGKVDMGDILFAADYILSEHVVVDSARRFFAHADSSRSRPAGWSLPQLTTFRAESEAPVSTGYLRTTSAHYCPTARLYSSRPPRSSQLPSTRTLVERVELRRLPGSSRFPCNH